jgi:hypothetical protein
MLTTLTALVIETVRLGHARHVLARRLREVEAELTRRQSGEAVLETSQVSPIPDAACLQSPQVNPAH